jgi:hypothetical protein
MTHKFQIDISMTATVSGSMAMQMLADAIEKETGKKVSDVKVNYEDGAVFKGFHVTFDPNTPATKNRASFKPSKEFIVETFGAED